MCTKWRKTSITHTHTHTHTHRAVNEKLYVQQRGRISTKMLLNNKWYINNNNNLHDSNNYQTAQQTNKQTNKNNTNIISLSCHRIGLFILIGAEDIRSGNIKLILGLIWTLIRRYQIGSQSKLPPKAMMLSWCNAILHPHVSVKNFSTDWNDGVALQ